VQGEGFRVEGLAFRVEGFGDLGRVQGWVFMVLGRVQGFRV